MKIGVIGLGSIGMRHAKNLQALRHEVVGYDPIKELRDLFPGRGMTEDAYVISSPTPDHIGAVINTLIAGRPTFVEKPISDSPLDGINISHIRIVGYNLRFHACIMKAKEWIDAGRIGKSLWANFTCGQLNTKPAYLRDGVILNWSHEIDLALHLLGRGYVETSSVRIVDGHDDMADILLTHENGCRTMIHLDYITEPEQRHFTIQGEKGRITCTLPARHLFLLTQHKDQADWFHGPGSYDTDYMDEMRAFVDRIEGKDVPGCTGPEALEVLKICLEVRRQAGL